MPDSYLVRTDTLSLYWSGGHNWRSDGITVTTRQADRLTAQVSHFTDFAVLGESYHTNLPLVLRE